MVFEDRGEHESQHERDSVQREGLTSADKERIKALERENRELRQADESQRSSTAGVGAHCVCGSAFQNDARKLSSSTRWLPSPTCTRPFLPGRRQ
jgi:hypothetical protein